ncbi:hypothetical protein HDU91_003771, partial [Kappamyces sp. JEL0680]
TLESSTNTVVPLSHQSSQTARELGRGVLSIDSGTMAVPPIANAAAQTSLAQKDAALAPAVPVVVSDALTAAEQAKIGASVSSVPEFVDKATAKVAGTQKERPTIESATGYGVAPPLRPVMAQYGQGNVNPTVPAQFMKTFNVRAPSSE